MRFTLFIVVLLLLCLAGFSQKTGWVNTGKTQLWKVTIIWDTVGSPEEVGYAEFAEKKWIPPPGDPTGNIPRQNTYVWDGKFFDAAKNPVEGVGSIYGTNPITKQKFQL